MVYNELEQGDILSQVRVGLAPIAYTDIPLRSIWAVYKIRQTPAQFYSRVGFVHAFHPLSTARMRTLLGRKWSPSGVILPENGVMEEATLAAIIRITGGNFRLLHRLLTQIARIVEINALSKVTQEVVEAAREALVIGAT